jgi:hypothetical protein
MYSLYTLLSLFFIAHASLQREKLGSTVLLCSHNRDILISILGAFAKLQKVTTSFVLSVCLSVCPYGTTWLPLEGFSWNLISVLFRTLLRKFQFHWNLCGGCHRLAHPSRQYIASSTQRVKYTLYINTNIYFCSYLAQFFLKWDMFQIKL